MMFLRRTVAVMKIKNNQPKQHVVSVSLLLYFFNFEKKQMTVIFTRKVINTFQVDHGY